jgi:regulator of replication initiation timing
MNKEEFLDKLKEIGTEEDEVARRTMLSDLTDEVTRVYDENSTLSEANTKYVEDNEKLRSANMQLFLKVGANKTEKEVNEDKTGIKEDKVEPRRFENLFDDKGGLK